MTVTLRIRFGVTRLLTLQGTASPELTPEDVLKIERAINEHSSLRCHAEVSGVPAEEAVDAASPPRRGTA